MEDSRVVYHGKWVLNDKGKLVCSICGREKKEDDLYCYCGARMDLDEFGKNISKEQTVHGKWYLAGDCVFRCSVCGRICHELDAPYCCCGSKMDADTLDDDFQGIKIITIL